MSSTSTPALRKAVTNEEVNFDASSEENWLGSPLKKTVTGYVKSVFVDVTPAVVGLEDTGVGCDDTVDEGRTTIVPIMSGWIAQ